MILERTNLRDAERGGEGVEGEGGEAAMRRYRGQLKSAAWWDRFDRECSALRKFLSDMRWQFSHRDWGRYLRIIEQEIR